MSNSSYVMDSKKVSLCAAFNFNKLIMRYLKIKLNSEIWVDKVLLPVVGANDYCRRSSESTHGFSIPLDS